METVQIVLLIGIFLCMALLMFLRKIPALIALPVMAFFIPFVGGVSLMDTIQLVIGQGTLRLYPAYTIAFFGSMLSVLLQKTGVAENFIKIGAELAGDKPWTIAVLMMALIAILFTTLGGLGAIIMVATIVLPIMSAVGISAMTTVGIFLFGLSIGGILNAGNWALYINVLGLSVSQIQPFAIKMFVLTSVTALAYITIQLYRDGQSLHILKILIVVISLFVIGTLFYYGFRHLPVTVRHDFLSAIKMIARTLKLLSGVSLVGLFIYNLLRLCRPHSKKIHWSAYCTPLVPLLLIMVFKIDFIAAFICGLIYGWLATYRKNHLNLLIQAVFQGGAVVMPAVVLMFGIGMLLNAIMGPGETWTQLHPAGWPVLNILRPFLLKVVPHNAWSYIVIFTLAAPLALYRGPLNVWGMGYGLAAILLTSGMPAGSIVGLLMAVGQVQGISDPTNTHNVWLANEMRQDVQKVLWNTLPYTWLVAFVGLVVAALTFL